MGGKAGTRKPQVREDKIVPGYAPTVDVSGLPKNVLKNALDKSHKLIKVDDQDTGEVIYCLVIEDDQDS